MITATPMSLLRCIDIINNSISRSSPVVDRGLLRDTINYSRTNSSTSFGFLTFLSSSSRKQKRRRYLPVYDDTSKLGIATTVNLCFRRRYLMTPYKNTALISGTKHMEKGWTYMWLQPWLGTGLLTRAGEIIMERMVNSLYWVDFFFNFTELGKELNQHLKVLHNFTMSVIQDKKGKLLSGDPELGTKKKRMALMDLLLEHHIKTKSLTEEDIREEVDTFAFEGHDTTSMGISWALYLIGLHKDVQEKVHEELDGIFGDDTERHANTDDLKDMKYLDCVLKESQRIYPSVPFIARQINEDTNICGYPIPKGTLSLVHIHSLHRDERWFPNPEKFDPDRFLPENCTNRHPFAYIPFSAGPRNCIGQRFAQMEEKIIVSTVLRHYTLESLDQRDKLPPAPELILRSSLPIRIKIRPREKLLSR
ncbi:unnamed protein product [Larinioides sclopetarius]|uniref:Cytochrome P450 n=1 Tax=Larinioides sclopetarius TaxID=280406 RepID=A0AAV1Z8Y8_9ARAC